VEGRIPAKWKELERKERGLGERRKRGNILRYRLRPALSSKGGPVKLIQPAGIG